MKRVPLILLAVVTSGLALATVWMVSAPRAVAAPPLMPAPAVLDAKAAPTSFTSKPAVGTKARCVVSGEEFVVTASTVSGTHNGKFYPFCCVDCKPTFEKDPAKYGAK